MSTEIKLPRLGQGMESGTIVKWLKSEGESIEKGEPLYELDTDKVTQEVESDASGVLLKITVQEGEVEVGRTIAVIGAEGEEVAPEADAAADADESPEEEGSRAPARDEERERGREASVATAEREAAGEPAAAAAPARADGRVKASPLARRIARERGLDLAAISGTGPEGRIVAEDVERAAAAPAPAPAPAPAAEDVEVVPLTSVRKTIARRLTEAWQAPVFQLTSSADMTRSLELRERLVERAGEGVKPTISDLLTKLCALGLMRNRSLNAHFVRDAIERHPSANVGIAVAAPQGLVVPVIHRCEGKSILEIAEVRAEVVGRARDNKLQRSDLEGGTFTISNLGMFGVEQFIAVLNPPQVAILAVGAIVERPVVEEGETVIRPAMTLTLTCDHRAVDGADGARFLADVKAFLEEPSLAL
jgi:pyruvate dehydrogenase E2 component (dihydrolipoyllysine-residue acetyltransferase)